MHLRFFVEIYAHVIQGSGMTLADRIRASFARTADVDKTAAELAIGAHRVRQALQHSAKRGRPRKPTPIAILRARLLVEAELRHTTLADIVRRITHGG